MILNKTPHLVSTSVRMLCSRNVGFFIMNNRIEKDKFHAELQSRVYKEKIQARYMFHLMVLEKDYNIPFGSYQSYKDYKFRIGDTERKGGNHLRVLDLDLITIDATLKKNSRRINEKIKITKHHQNKIESIRNKYKFCVTCEEMFEPNNSMQVNCSEFCFLIHRAKFTQKFCGCCGKEFTSYYKRFSFAYCSEECVKSNKRNQRKKYSPDRGKTHRKRARVNGKQYETIDKYRVFKDDNYICYLCGELTDYKSGYDFNNKKAPTIDHVVPLTDKTKIGNKYGHHLRYNLRCACMICNSNKGNKLLENFNDYFYTEGKQLILTSKQLKLEI